MPFRYQTILRILSSFTRTNHPLISLDYIQAFTDSNLVVLYVSTNVKNISGWISMFYNSTNIHFY